MVFLDCIQIVPQIDIFVRSGFIYLPGASGAAFRSAVIRGGYWSSRGGAATTAYYLQIETSAVKPSIGPNSRYHGFSLSCLSTVLGM
jgi:hypothetical protein